MAPKAVLKRPAGRPPKVQEIEEEEEDEIEEEEEEEEEEVEQEEEEEEEEEVEEDEAEEPVAQAAPKNKKNAAGSSPQKPGSSPQKPQNAAGSSPATKRRESTSVSSQATALSPVKNSPAKESLQVEYSISGSYQSPLAEGLVQLRRKLHRCDAAILAGGGARIPVHAVVLASQSVVLDRKLEESGPEVDLGSVTHEAAHFLVRWIYGEVTAESYNPSNAKTNEEVLRLASELGLPMLAQICSTRLCNDVTRKNVVERVRLCEAFGLPELRAALLTALVEDRAALDAVARDEATLAHPALMRELLASVASKAMEDQQAREADPKRQRVA